MHLLLCFVHPCLPDGHPTNSQFISFDTIVTHLKSLVIPIVCTVFVLGKFCKYHFTNYPLTLSVYVSLISWFFGDILWYRAKTSNAWQANEMRGKTVWCNFHWTTCIHDYEIRFRIFWGFGVFPIGCLLSLVLHSSQFESDEKNNDKFVESVCSLNINQQ